MKVIDNNTAELNESISQTFKYIKNIKQMSEQMKNSVNEIAKGVGENASSTEIILRKTNDATDKVEKVRILSNDTKEYSNKMITIVQDYSHTIERMAHQINTVDDAIRAAYTTVSLLNEDMEKINSFLSNITQISQHYKIDKTENCFYFFNPFSVHIFRKVVKNILHSVEKHRRTVDLILYYPIREYKDFLEADTPFSVIDKIRVPDASNKKEKFLIYRLKEES